MNIRVHRSSLSCIAVVAGLVQVQVELVQAGLV